MGWETEIPNVVAGQPITSSWGNTIRDSVVHTVATVAALPSTGITDGDVAYVTATARLHVRKASRWWAGFATQVTGKTTDASGVVTVTAADVGLVTLLAGIGDVAWTPATTAVFLATSRFTTGTLQVRVMQTVAGTTGFELAISEAGVAVTIDCYVEGYAT